MTVARLRRLGGGDSPIRMLLLHGMAGSTAVWDEFTACAAGQSEIWDVELPWSVTGDGSWASGTDIPGAIASALASMPLRPAGEPHADLVVAHSFGASALLELLSSGWQARVGAVVLAAPLSCPEPFDWSEIGRKVEEFPRLLEEGIAHRTGARIGPQTRRDLALRLRDLIGPLPWLRTYEYCLRAATLDLARLTTPVLIVAGADDRISAVSDVERMARKLPDVRFEIFEDCGHFPMIDRVERFTETVDMFIQVALNRIDCEPAPNGESRGVQQVAIPAAENGSLLRS
ncbi:alpha/beta fold hydrolase [Nocardia fluminea]|uniref:alpha/beta fold hydrolase n=1 Tax=Nocardia fluminea TaxID=134984 RepID=UPI003D1153E4